MQLCLSFTWQGCSEPAADLCIRYDVYIAALDQDTGICRLSQMPFLWLYSTHNIWSSLWQSLRRHKPCQHCITCRPLSGPFVLLSDLSSRNSSATSPSLSCFSLALYQSSPCVHLSSVLQRSVLPVWCANTLLRYYLYTPCCTKSSILQNRLSVGNSSSSLGHSSTCRGTRWSTCICL